MHHLPISKKSRETVFCNHAWADEGGRGGGMVLSGAPLLVWSYLGLSEKQSVAAGPVVRALGKG
jgi:hypothetical protein